MSLSRRCFMARGAAFAAGFSGLHAFLASNSSRRSGLALAALADNTSPGLGYGPLVPDPAKIFDLPAGFSYTVISRVGETMDDGFLVPGDHDGMAAFPGPNGTTIIVRNHELRPQNLSDGPFGPKNELLPRIDKSKLYDFGNGLTPGLGGTTTLVYNTKARKLEKHFLSLAGTVRNCAGGPTPWNTWLTCEEDTTRPGMALPDETDGRSLEKDHGYVFEVPASDTIALADPKPIRAMGRFNHEAVAIDPKTGIVYMTEDQGDGVLYRFIPNVPGSKDQPANYHAGGRLQALKVTTAAALDTRNWDEQRVQPEEVLQTDWITLDDVESPNDDLRHRAFARGAARFARGEGMWFGNDAIYFACTNGGKAKAGQIWKLIPSDTEFNGEGDLVLPGMLQLFIEPNDPNVVHNADNITVAPWGDLFVCEDADKVSRLLGVTKEGNVYQFGQNAMSKSELAGAAFSPDGSTLFVNIQHDGLTLAITGPWRA
jgi:uncharacterized protein